jgi:NAD(P)-dependent dehydrogenase (short-subunit alcohol dehydrogenase family)
MSTIKVALITGTSSGIGLATAIACAKAGYVVVATMRDLRKSNALRTRALADHVSLDIQALDVQSDESVAEAITYVYEHYGHMDLLINNAGTGYVGTTEHTSVADLQGVLDINLYGVWRVTQAVLPRMREAQTGQIITVSSIGGILGQPFNDAYCAAKFAVEGMMEGLAPVVAGFGIHVSVVEPGPVATQFVENATGIVRGNPEALKTDPYAAPMTSYMTSVMGRYASIAQTADDIAAVIVDTALADEPHFRVQTSAFVRDRAGAKFIDPTGDQERDIAIRMLWPSS